MSLIPDVHRYTQPVSSIGLHLSFGATIVLLVLVRLAWRFSHKPPAESSILQRRYDRSSGSPMDCFALPWMGWANG